MKNRLPSYRLHKSSSLAVVTLGGKDYYLGKHGSEESLAEYRRLTGLYVANGLRMPSPRATVTVNKLLLRYYDHACAYYRKEGRPTSQLRFMRAVCRRMRDLFGTTDVATIGTADLLALRKSWIADGNARNVVNRKVMATRRILDWGVEAGIVPGSVSHATHAVRGLSMGRSAAPDRDPVRPVPADVMEATIAHLKPRTVAMVRLQVLTGMRPGEACQIRGMDIDRDAVAWTYTPGSHKTEHRGRARMIAIGPRAQAILRPWLDRRPPDAYAFSREGMHPLSVDSYRRSISTAARAAGVEPWGPNRLRHNFATEVRRRFGLEAAQVALGHAGADVTQVYAESDLARAAEVAVAIG